MTFRLASLSAGANPIYWNTLQSLIGVADIPIEPDASYKPYQEAVKTMAGTKYGRGYASAVWSFSGLSPEQKYILRQICTDLSADVYIETPTNDFDVSGNQEWIQAQAVMEWTEGEQDIQGGMTIDFEITFTRLIEVP
jgi:hypothetical protein